MRANAKHHMFILFIDLSAMFFIDHRLNKRQQNRDYDWWGEELIVMILILLDLIVHASFLEIIVWQPRIVYRVQPALKPVVISTHQSHALCDHLK